MGDFFEALQTLGRIAEGIRRDGSIEIVQAVRAIIFRIRTVTRLAIAWPFVLLLAAMPSGKYWPVQYIVLGITFSILIIFLWMATELGPLKILIGEALFSPETPLLGEFVEKARKATNALRVMLGLELLAGIYFSWVPIANDRALALTQVLLVAAIVCFIRIKKWEPIVAILAIAFIVITLIFFPWDKIHPGKIFAKTQDSVTESAKANDQQNKPPATQQAAQTPPAVPQKKPEGLFPKDSGDSASSLAKQPAPPAAPAPEPIRWFKPVSGDEGGYIVLISSGRYVAAGKVGFQISIQPPDGLASEGLYINESDGEDNMGSFSAYPNAIAENFVHCAGPAYPCKMFPGMPTFLTIEVDRPSGVKTFAFSLKVAPGGGEWIEYDFTSIPVEER